MDAEHLERHGGDGIMKRWYWLAYTGGGRLFQHLSTDGSGRTLCELPTGTGSSSALPLCLNCVSLARDFDGRENYVLARGGDARSVRPGQVAYNRKLM